MRVELDQQLTIHLVEHPEDQPFEHCDWKNAPCLPSLYNCCEVRPQAESLQLQIDHPLNSVETKTALQDTIDKLADEICPLEEKFSLKIT